jgi:curli production assembly/transport component CsgG
MNLRKNKIKTQALSAKHRNAILFLSLFLTANLISGCANYLAPFQTNPATLGEPTAITKELQSLPLPKEKIVAAVYKFRDQTGQYKASETGGSFSTAVTQGATSILLKALEQSGWFVAIEREGLSNLLNERKIIRSSRANYEEEGSQQDILPPLLFAGIILEGGIISYDTNILTGGMGIKYFGAGGSGQYRQDRVTIYLRAVSTQSGRILKTVYTSKTVLSQMVDVGLFRFVKFKRLLEVETGYSYNEPVELCVTEAIEKAVQALIIEGLFDRLWELQNPEEINSPVINRYLAEKEQNNNLDQFGNILPDKPKYGIGINIGSQLIAGDYANAQYQPAGSIRFSSDINKQFSLALNFGRGIFSNENAFDITTNSVQLSGSYNIFPQYSFTPFLIAGGGILFEEKTTEPLSINKSYPVLFSGAGFQYLMSDNLGLSVSLSYNYLFTDDLDRVEQGYYNDYYWNGLFGITYYLNL